MPLSVGADRVTFQALHQLAANDREQQVTMRRLATGLRISSAADDASGLVISEQLRAQIRSNVRAQRNTQTTIHLLRTAEAGLSEAAAQLTDLRATLVRAASSGSMTGEQVQAEQQRLDQSVNALSRISTSTRFGSLNLLNGSSSVRATNITSGIESVAIESVSMGSQSSQRFDIGVFQKADRAQIQVQIDPSGAQGTANVIENDETYTITGERGSADIYLQGGSTAQDLADRVNEVFSQTGVQAQTSAGTTIILKSEYVGSAQEISITAKSGDELYAVAGATGTPAAVAEGDSVSAAGVDAVAKIGNTFFTGAGNTIKVNTPSLKATVTLSESAKVNRPKYNPGDIIDAIDITSVTGAGNAGAEGITSDGVSIYVSSGNQVHQFNALSYAYQTSLQPQIGGTNLIIAGAEGMAVTGSQLFTDDWANPFSISNINAVTGAINAANTKSTTRNGIEYVGGTIYFVDNGGDEVESIQASNMDTNVAALPPTTLITPTSNFALNPGGDYYGIVSDGTYFYVGEKTGNQVQVYTQGGGYVKTLDLLEDGQPTATQVIRQQGSVMTDLAYNGENLLILSNDASTAKIYVVSLGTKEYGFDVVAAGAQTDAAGGVVGQQGGIQVQLGATNAVSDSIVLSLPSIDPSRLGVTPSVVNGVSRGGYLTDLKSGAQYQMGDPTQFENQLAIIDGAIAQVSSSRATIGAVVAQQLESNVTAMGVQAEQLGRVQSLIRDTDYAEEISRSVGQQILSQSGLGALSAANQRMSRVLDLLPAR